LKRGSIRGEVLELSIHLPQPRERRAVVLVEQRVGLLRQLAQAAGVLLHGLLRAQLLLLAGAERRGLDLARLELEHLAAALQFAAVAAQRLQLGLDPRALAMPLRHRLGEGLETGLAVQQREMRLRSSRPR
jgi:hypothetical protein